MNSITPLQSLVFDGRGGARSVPPSDIGERSPDEVHWLHLDYKDPTTIEWLRERSGIDSLMADALLAEDPRPRSLVQGDSLLVILRGANLNQGAERDDMVSLRLWIEAGRVLTFRHRRLLSVQEVVDQLLTGHGPMSSGDLLCEIVARMLAKIGEVVGDIEDSADELEELVLTTGNREVRTRLSALRRESISIRRFIAPQRDTIARLHAERVSWLDDSDRAHLRESADRTTRYIEDLDSARDRAAVTYEELSNRLAEEMNSTMYRLSIVAAIFLPLGLLTGLLGINVGGMPGTESPSAFTLVCVSLVLMALALWAYFKRNALN